MSVAQRLAAPVAKQVKLPPLEQGDHLDQKTFHERYEAMPRHVRAELIGGIVYMPSPLRLPHGSVHPDVTTWINFYKMKTPGTQVLDNATVILGEDSEPQPDVTLRVLPEFGGQSKTSEDEYVVGSPELLTEIASSSESYDLHTKRRDYERANVLEYVVVVLRQERIVWLRRGPQGFEPLEPGSDGIYRSEIFPGLWLDAEALFRGDLERVLEVLQQGLASPEHAQFVGKLRQKK